MSDEPRVSDAYPALYEQGWEEHRPVAVDGQVERVCSACFPRNTLWPCPVVSHLLAAQRSQAAAAERAELLALRRLAAAVREADGQRQVVIAVWQVWRDLGRQGYSQGTQGGLVMRRAVAWEQEARDCVHELLAELDALPGEG